MKILVIRFSSLGDVILASAVLDPLYENGFQVDFLTFKPFDELYKYDYRVRKLISLEKKELKSIKDIYRFAKGLKKEKYDLILDLHSNLRSFLISKFSGIKTIRYKKEGLRRRLKLLNPEFNVVKAYLETLKKLGIKNVNIYRPKLILKDEEIRQAKKIVPENFVVLGTGARYINKIYPYYNRVAELLLERGFNVVLVGSQQDKKLDTSTYPKNVIDLRGKLSLRESLAIISLAELTISNDSAIAHMSRAVGVPVLVIYGATHPYFGFAPLKEEGDYIFLGLECQPCDLHGKGECKRGDRACLTWIKPEDVVEKALKLLKSIYNKRKKEGVSYG